MSNQNHTPGEWTLDNRDVKVNGNLLATAYKMIGYHNDENGKSIECNEALANAKLIASAPELLEALIYVKDYFYKYHNQPSEEAEILKQVNSAIKKATE